MLLVHNLFLHIAETHAKWDTRCGPWGCQISMKQSEFAAWASLLKKQVLVLQP